MKRLLSVLVIVLLLAAPVAALAQDGGNPLCNGLSDEDCTFLTAAQAKVATATSFAISSASLQFNFNDGTQETEFSMTASGEVMLPTSGQLLLHLVLSDISMTPADPTVPSDLEVLVLDNMQYVNYEGEWYGKEIAEKDLADLNNTLGQATGAMSMGDLSATGIDLTGVATTTRTEDMEGIADFKTSLDVGKLLVAVLSSPNLGALLGQSGADMGMGDLTPEDMAMMGAILQPMMAGTTVDLEQGFGLEDQYLRKLVLDVNINLDLSMFGGDAGKPITGALYLELNLDKVNETFEASAPESFKPWDELQGKLDNITQGIGGLGM